MSTITVELIIKMKTKFTSFNAEKTNGFISPQMSEIFTPHHVSKKSADFRCQKRTLWTWQDAAPVVTERSTNLETLPLYIAKFWRVQRCNFFRVGNRICIVSYSHFQKLHLCTLVFLYLFLDAKWKKLATLFFHPKRFDWNLIRHKCLGCSSRHPVWSRVRPAPPASLCKIPPTARSSV